jgi:hypothetical protein
MPNTWLTLEMPLNPFKREDETAYTSLDCIDIETQLGMKIKFIFPLFYHLTILL